MTETMTVAKLIELLSQYDEDTELMLSGYHGYGASIDAYAGDWRHLGTIWEDGGNG